LTIYSVYKIKEKIYLLRSKNRNTPVLSAGNCEPYITIIASTAKRQEKNNPSLPSLCCVNADIIKNTWLNIFVRSF